MQKLKRKAFKITDGQNCSNTQTKQYKLFPENIIVYKKDYYYIGVFQGCGFILSISHDENLTFIYALRRLELICEQNGISAKRFRILISQSSNQLKKVDSKTFYDVLFQKQNLLTINTRGFEIDKEDLARSRRYRQAKTEVS